MFSFFFALVLIRRVYERPITRSINNSSSSNARFEEQYTDGRHASFGFSLGNQIES